MTDMNNQLFELYKQNLINEFGGSISHGFISDGYWAWKCPEKKETEIVIRKQYIKYKECDADPLPFLLSLVEEFPDAPDLLRYIAQSYFQNYEYISAIKYYIKLFELYPFVKDYREEIEVCRTFIDYGSMPETDESDEWLIKKLKEIDEKYWKY